ncbi:MAG TPA: hypothetical protein VMT52_06600 [Planctomycetota bacterium]|nr:hypothetical protein [Planctomycetota bacterium]
MPHARSLILLPLFLWAGFPATAGGAVPGGQEAGQDASPAEGDPSSPPEIEPEFRKASSKVDFKKARGLYDEGKMKEAESLFKKIKSDGKTKADKDEVDRWLLAAGGAQLLEKLKVRLKQTQIQQAYQEAESYARKYAATPIGPAFKVLVDELAQQIYLVIESFDTPSARYLERNGKAFVKDEKLLLDGTSCLRWTHTQDKAPSALKIAGVPTDWRGFEAVEMWVNVTQPPAAPEAVILCLEGGAAAKKKAKTAKKKKTSGPRLDIFRIPCKLSPSKQWQRVRLPIAEFQSQGDASLTSVEAFQIQVAGGQAFDILIDRIVLVRKNPGAGPDAAAKKKAGGGT